MKNRFKKINSYLSLIGMGFSLYLMVKDIVQTDYCPKFLGLPACYIVFFAFFLVHLSTKMKKHSELLFILGGLAGIGLGIFFSLKEILEAETCPRVIGVPLCYASFIVFMSMMILFLKYRRIEKESRAA